MTEQITNYLSHDIRRPSRDSNWSPHKYKWKAVFMEATPSCLLLNKSHLISGDLSHKIYSLNQQAT